MRVHSGALPSMPGEMLWSRADYVSKFEQLREAVGGGATTILEVGAHYGEDSVRLLGTFPAATVHCFEPDPRNIAIFRKHVSSSAIRLYEAAVTNHVGEADFYMSYHDVSQGSATPDDKYGWISAADYRDLKLHRSGASSLKPSNEQLVGTARVTTTTLDAWAQIHLPDAAVDLLWVDVQGAERDVLEGATALLERTRYVWMEYGEGRIYDGAMDAEETCFAMAQRGFHARYAEGAAQGDILFGTSRC